GRRSVPFLDGVAAAERCPAPAVHKLPANVEVLVDDEHGRPEIPRPDGGMQPHAPRPEDDHVRFIVPSDALSARFSRPRQGRHTDACGSPAGEEISPAESLLALKLWFLPPGVAFLGHVRSSLEPGARQRRALFGGRRLPELRTERAD